MTTDPTPLDELGDRIRRNAGPELNEAIDRALATIADAQANRERAEAVRSAAARRWLTDPVAHARAELAVRVVDATVGLDEQRDRDVAREAAAVALELAERTELGDRVGEELTAAEAAEAYLAGALAAHGAPDPTRMARSLLEGLGSTARVGLVRLPT